jgi:FkbM family methyltransferase
MKQRLELSFGQRKGWVAHVYKAAFQNHHRQLEPLLRPHVPTDAVVVDVGAHAGQFSKLFARLAPQGVVHAFEPSPYALSVLDKAIGWNRLSHVRIHRCGLGAEAGALELRTPVKRSGGLGFGLAHMGASTETRAVRVDRVEIRTLDEFAETEQLQRLDFIKADIEGWEGKMLEGGLATITRFKPAMLMELVSESLARSGMTRKDVQDMLAPLGYRGAVLTADSRFTPVEAWDVDADYLLIAKS